MNRKLIFFDIDGTIIPEDTGVIPESTKEAIKKAKENGCTLVLCDVTGALSLIHI